MLSRQERTHWLSLFTEVEQTPNYRYFRSDVESPGLKAGSIVQDLYGARWYGAVEAVFVLEGEHLNVLVRLLCTEDGRPYRKKNRLVYRDPAWFRPVVAIPYREGAPLA